MKLTLLTDSFVAVGPTRDVKVHICHFDDENVQCSYLKQLYPPTIRQLSHQIYNHFNHQRHLESRQSFKQKRATALMEWFNLCFA